MHARTVHPDRQPISELDQCGFGRTGRISKSDFGRGEVSSRDSDRIDANQAENYEEVSDAENELSNLLPSECVSGLRGVLWHRCADSGALEAEPFLALKKRVPSWVSCERSQLREATLACAYSVPDDDLAEQTYEAIRRWMNVKGYRLAGPKRELNLGQMLEIQFPLMEN